MKFLTKIRRDRAVARVIYYSQRLNTLHAIHQGLTREFWPEEYDAVVADIEHYERKKDKALTYLKETA